MLDFEPKGSGFGEGTGDSGSERASYLCTRQRRRKPPAAARYHLGGLGITASWGVQRADAIHNRHTAYLARTRQAKRSGDAVHKARSATFDNPFQPYDHGHVVSERFKIVRDGVHSLPSYLKDTFTLAR